VKYDLSDYFISFLGVEDVVVEREEEVFLLALLRSCRYRRIYQSHYHNWRARQDSIPYQSFASLLESTIFTIHQSLPVVHRPTGGY
jgi:hypothetical protein